MRKLLNRIFVDLRNDNVPYEDQANKNIQEIERQKKELISRAYTKLLIYFKESDYHKIIASEVKTKLLTNVKNDKLKS